MRELDNTDLKRLRDILLQHPLLATERKRYALLINSNLAFLLDEVDPKEDIYDFVVLLFAQLLKNLTMRHSGNPWLVSLLSYLVDFSRPEDLALDDHEFLLQLMQSFSKKPVQSPTRTRRFDKNDLSAETNTRRKKDPEPVYLKLVIKELEWLEITGLPRGIVAQSAPLDEVFIPLQFRPNRPLTEYPLTENELAAYYRSLQDNQPQQALERVVFEAEKNWSTITRTGQTISINDFWQSLTKERPAVVIQGYPGMGKSTFLRYLALYMARHRIKQRSETILAPLTPTLVPFLVSLGDFAQACTEDPDLTLLSYLQITLKRLPIPDLTHLLATSLEAGRSLILLDGLDEVSGQVMRLHIQTEIKRFVSFYGDTFEESSAFNRFIITSRVAGYDQAAFPSYPHYTIAELSPEQIDDFLPRWCRAIVRLDPAFTFNNKQVQENSSGTSVQLFTREVKRRTEELRATIRNRAELQILVENPLLLTLLALMQQNQIEIPRQRVDLYRIFTQTLLERRSEIAGTPFVPEIQAILRLGPIAFRMQETNNGFMHQNEVLASLLNTIGLEEGVTNVRQEAEEFLYKMRVYVGIFLLRAGDFYAFLHRTFQEYFAARYILHAINLREDELPGFIKKTYQDYTIWREPFLLALAYASSKDITLANKMMRTLLIMPPDIDPESRALRLQIAVESLIEARPASIDPALERQIAEQLLQVYEEAQHSGAFERCKLIEELVQNWLNSLPKHIHNATVLNVLREAISNIEQVSLQRATLTLIAMFIEQQKPWSDSILATLIPPLLSLAGLPALEPYQPVPWLAASSDMAVADLALIVLTLLRIQGPPGLLPARVRQHFTDHPEQLHTLAQHSVASNVLLTPTVIPRKDEFSYHWPGDPFLRQWLSLRDGPHAGRAQEEKERICLTIQQGLLECAEEMRYPLTFSIIQVLEQAQQQPEKSWQRIWQDYLLASMNSEQYVSYQESALLWSILFPESEGFKKLAETVLEHLHHEGSPVQRYAQRFLATLADSMRIQEELREIGEIDGEMFLQYLRFWLDIREVLVIEDPQNLRYWRYLRDMHSLQHLRDMQGEEPLHNPEAIQRLQAFLFTAEITQHCCARLTLVSLEGDEYLDLLTVLLGRVLSLWTTKTRGLDVEQELQQLVQALRLDILLTGNDERPAIVLDILRYLRFLSVLLPVRTPEEVSNVLQLAEEMVEEQWLQEICIESLQHAMPEILEAGKRVKAERQSRTPGEEPAIKYESLSHIAEPGLPTTSTASPSPHSRESAIEASAVFSIGKPAIEEERSRCDVCIVCALSEETEIFMREISRLCHVRFHSVFGTQTRRSYRYTTIKNNQGEPITLYITWLPSYGPEETGLHLKPVFSELQPRFTAMTGICAGEREKTALGDIIVAERAFLYDTGKVVSDKRGRKKLLPDTRTWHPDQDILHFVHLFDAWKPSVADMKRPISKRQQRDWLLYTLLQETTSRVDDIPLEELTQHAPAWKRITHELQSAPKPYLTRDRALCDPARVRELYYGKDDFPFRDPEQPRCHVVPMASGSTVRSDNSFEEIQRPVRGAIAIDMEGATFYRTVADFPGLPSLLVKGVCDYADADKDDSYHEYASAVSAIYTLCFIKEYVTTTLIPDTRRDI